MTAKTKKEDWFTGYLRSCGYWVGGNLVRSEHSRLVEAQETLRIFKGSKGEFHIIHVLIFNGAKIQSFDYKNYSRILREKFCIDINFSLLIWPNELVKFKVCFSDDRTMDGDTPELLEVFWHYDKSYVSNATKLKPLNKSYTDFFHLWARNNTNGFQNDIDAINNLPSQLSIVELKRPVESVETWKPYLADKVNYRELARFSNLKEISLINIAYNESNPGTIQVFRNLEAKESKALVYEASLITFSKDQSLQSLISRAVFSPRVSSR